MAGETVDKENIFGFNARFALLLSLFSADDLSLRQSIKIFTHYNLSSRT